MSEKLSTRVERLENLVGILAEKQAHLDDVLVILTEAQIKSTEAQIKTEERFRETDRLIRERNLETNERIDKLVSAIGELVRRSNGGKG